MLELKNITKIYGGTVALSKVNVAVTEGTVQGIIGKNGAGKTTLVGIMSGLITPTEGEIVLNDKSFKSLSRKRARKNGISIVTQEADIIPEWTVAENLFVPDFVCSLGGQSINWNVMYEKAEEILSKHNLIIGVHEKVKDLTISEQQLLLVIKAFYVEKSSIVILDEVSTALSKNEEENLFKIIEEQKKLGKAIIYISHRMDELLRVCDSITVVRDGEIVATESCNEMDIEQLSSYIIGDDKFVEKLEQEISPEPGFSEQVLNVENLTKIGTFNDISFSLRKGEVIGFAGLRGSGRTEIFKAIAGIDPADEGVISVGNQNKVRFMRPTEAINSGVVYLTEDRDKEGLVNVLSVRDNLTISSLKKVSTANFINQKVENTIVDNLIDLLSIRTPSANEKVSNLSGGNRQKVMLGKVFAIHPKVYLLDEPTKGIDISAKKDVLDFIRKELVKDSGVIITLPDIPGLMDICDRIFVINNGKLVNVFLKAQFNEVDIYNATQGINNGSNDNSVSDL